MDLAQLCFTWEYVHKIYLAPPGNRRFIEEFLMSKRVMYEEGEKQLSLCEMCKPTIQYLHPEGMLIGFSKKTYTYCLFGLELIMVSSLFENAYKAIEKTGLQQVRLPEIIKLKRAEETLCTHSSFDRGFMLCSNCIEDNIKMHKFLVKYVRQKIALDYSPLLIPQADNIIITGKAMKSYYDPALSEIFINRQLHRPANGKTTQVGLL